MTIPSTTADALGRVRTPIATIVRRLAAVSALALALFGVNVSTAAAGSDESIITDGGAAFFYANGTEQLFVSDDRVDRLGVRAQLKWKGGSLSLNDVNGAGNGFKHQKLVLREGTNVWLRLCYTNNGRNVRCSGWQQAEA